MEGLAKDLKIISNLACQSSLMQTGIKGTRLVCVKQKHYRKSNCSWKLKYYKQEVKVNIKNYLQAIYA